jgi:hypothetical protein
MNLFERSQEMIVEKSLQGGIQDFLVEKDECPTLDILVPICGANKI